MDLEKLAKLMAMTTATNDGEALNAVRLANAMLKQAGKEWSDILAPQHVVNISISKTGARTVRPQTDFEGDPAWQPPHLNDENVIGMMFREVYATPRGSEDEFWEFMDSIHERFRRHKNLTQRQYDALRRSYLRVKRSGT